MMIGNVELRSDKRCVMVSNRPFKLGSRAYDMLELLASAGGALVSKREIMRRVWPNTVVAENNVHVQISAIRKMLGSNADLLIVVPGRGYRLAIDMAYGTSNPISGNETTTSNLPSAGVRLYGRESVIEEVSEICGTVPLVSLAGTGGVGKTCLAIEVGRRLLNKFADGVWLVELATVTAPQLVPENVANTLHADAMMDGSPLQALVASLKNRQLLVILDNCEHVIDAAAEVAEAIGKFAPACRVIATSREPLKVPGEVVVRIPTLDVPAQDEADDEVMNRSAIQLFFSRIRRANERLSGEDRATIALAGEICRRLDGLPLAIELAASKVSTLGMVEFAANLDTRFAILASGYRMALPQHQTLQAAFDWSYDLLSPRQQMVLRRVSIFPCGFDLDAAIRISTEDEFGAADIVEAVCALAEKSLFVQQGDTAPCQYRLLETSRAYASQKLTESGEEEEVGQRFVRHVSARLERTLMAACADPDQRIVEDFRLQLDDVRAALHATFSIGGDVELGVELITMATPMFFGVGLSSEVQQHARSALIARRTKTATEWYPDPTTRLLSMMAGPRDWAGNASRSLRDATPDFVPAGRHRLTRPACRDAERVISGCGLATLADQ
jgi:predicted ATPase/DNA-binding winged helix-turn-helix (wHTH) protein